VDLISNRDASGAKYGKKKGVKQGRKKAKSLGRGVHENQIRLAYRERRDKKRSFSSRTADKVGGECETAKYGNSPGDATGTGTKGGLEQKGKTKKPRKRDRVGSCYTPGVAGNTKVGAYRGHNTPKLGKRIRIQRYSHEVHAAGNCKVEHGSTKELCRLAEQNASARPGGGKRKIRKTQPERRIRGDQGEKGG